MKESQQIALITGAGRRIGRALALHLAQRGWHIAAHYHRSHVEATALAADVEALGRRCVMLQADLQNVAEVQTLLPRAKASLGAITLLINNAALFQKDSLETLSPETWQRHQSINQLAPLLLIQGFAGQLPAEGQGNIVNLLDGNWGWSLSPDFLSYTVSKQGLRFLTEFLAPLLAPRIRINGIALGSTIPGQEDKADTFAKIAASAPLQRTTTLSDVFAALDYLLAADSVTGHVIEIAGGLHLRLPHYVL